MLSGAALPRTPSLKKLLWQLTSASLEDINLRTTCLRYSKLISRESFRSTELVTTMVEGGGLLAGGGSGHTFSCLSARPSGGLSFPSGSGSGFSFYREPRAETNVGSNPVVVMAGCSRSSPPNRAPPGQPPARLGCRVGDGDSPAPSVVSSSAQPASAATA